MIAERTAPAGTVRAPTARRRLAAFWWLPGTVVFALLRLPSLIQPHWYTDEAGYAAAGREMLSGRMPYSQIWNNKPPLHLATIGAVVHGFGYSETALHVLTFVFSALALAAAAYVVIHLFRPGVAAILTLAVAALLGLPLFDADLALPESLLIAPATWAAALIVVRLHQGRTGGVAWTVLAGLLAAAAVCYQQTAVADAGAFGLILLLHPAARLRHFLAYAAAGIGATAAWVVPLLFLVGPHTLAFALVGFYTGDYNLSALPEPGGRAGHVALMVLAVVLAVAGAVLARVLLRRGARGDRSGNRTGESAEPPGGAAWMLAVWATAALLVPAAAQQPFAHFAGPAVIPCALTLFAAWPRRAPWRLPRATLATAVPLAGAMVIAGMMARSAGADWVPNAGTAGVNGYRNLSTYYAGAWQVWTGRKTWTRWELDWDERAAADTAVAEWLHDHGLAGRRAVVWSSDAWPYLLAALPVLLPTPPIYNNFVLLGSNGEVTDRVRALDPEIIVVSDDTLVMFPEITPLLQHRYRETFASLPDRVLLREDLASSVR